MFLIVERLLYWIFNVDAKNGENILTRNRIDMSEYSFKESVQMLTSSLVYGGPMTFEQIKELDWLKHTSEYGISFYIREAERNEWIKTKCFSGDKPNIYSATAKGRKMAEARD